MGMKKLLKEIYSVIVVISIISPYFYAGELNTEITTENEHLTTIFDNSLILVRQIKNKTYDEKQRTISIKNIDKAYKKLSVADRMALEEDIAIIKEESQEFSSLRKQPQKYSSAQAEKALQHMGVAIQNLVERTSEEMISQAQQQLSHAINKTEKITKEAQKIIQKAQEDLMVNRITSVDAARIIGEQNYIIGAAQRALKKEMEQATDTVVHNDEQTSYFNQFVGGVYSLTSRALAPFKSGYGYTSEEQEKARAIIMQLEQQLATIFDTYGKAIEQAQTPQERVEFIRALEFMAQEIIEEINQQKVITGEVMSTKRKLFWGTVAVAGAVTAGLLGYRYFMTPTEETPNVLAQQPAVVPTKQETVSTTAVTQEKITEEPKAMQLVEQKSAEQEQKVTTAVRQEEQNIVAAMAEQEPQKEEVADKEEPEYLEEKENGKEEEEKIAAKREAEEASFEVAELLENEQKDAAKRLMEEEVARRAEEERIAGEQAKIAAEQAVVQAKIEAAMAEQESIIKKQEEAAEKQAKIAAEQAAEDAKIEAEIDEQIRIIKEQQQKEADKKAEEERIADDLERERLEQESADRVRLEAEELAVREQLQQREQEEAAVAEAARQAAEVQAKRAAEEEAAEKATQGESAQEEQKLAADAAKKKARG